MFLFMTKTDLKPVLEAIKSLERRFDGLEQRFDNLDQKFATKDDLKNFATKDDLKNFATKDDLKNFATKDDLKLFATKVDTKKEFEAFAASAVQLFATKKDLETMEDRLNTRFDEITGNYKDADEEVMMLSARVDRHEEDIGHLKTAVGIK